MDHASRETSWKSTNEFEIENRGTVRIRIENKWPMSRACFVLRSLPLRYASTFILEPAAYFSI